MGSTAFASPERFTEVMPTRVDIDLSFSSWHGLSGPPIAARAGRGGPDKPCHDDWGSTSVSMRTGIIPVRVDIDLSFPSWPGVSGPPIAARAGRGGPDKPCHDDWDSPSASMRTGINPTFHS